MADWLVAHGVRISGTLWNSVSSVSEAEWLSDHRVRFSATALEKALESQYIDVADFLASNGIGRMHYFDSETHMRSFLRSRNFVAVEWLFKHCQLYERDVADELRAALERNDGKAADLLVLHANNLAKTIALECAIRQNKLERVQWLTSHGAVVGIEALKDAVAHGQLEEASRLIEYRVPVNSGLWLMVPDNVTVAQWLLAHHVPMDDCALKIALNNNRFNLANWLIKHGLSVQDAWDHVISSENFDAAQWLFENHRARLTSENIRAAMRGRDDLLERYLYERTTLFERYPVLTPVVATSGVAVAGGILFALIKHLNKA